MSPHAAKVTLDLLNGIIGAAYLALSLGFCAFWTIVTRLMAVDLNIKTPARYLNACFAGSVLFLAGCGIHHLHLATEIVPNSINRFGKESIWVTHFWHAAITMFAQAVGAPLMLVAGAVIVRRVRGAGIVFRPAEG